VSTTVGGPHGFGSFHLQAKKLIRIRCTDADQDPDPSIIKSKENLDFFCFLPFYDFLSSKNDVNVPSKRKKHKNFEKKINFLLVS
jgi:hypothetical protein